MDCIMVLSKIIKIHDVIMVLVDKLSKEINFIPIKSTYKSIDVESFLEINIHIVYFS
jgi:hypothetical protein